jgi:hypothetical protein
MNSKEKANELFYKYLDQMPDYFKGKQGRNTSKKNALICVQEQLSLIDDYASRQMLTNWSNAVSYWIDVKNEIEKL